ncbi:hypothetical protein U91I_01194 [alpha proteobacterium U9-1i]|nr:hypothetical protein U91I_01194 [alpha proteobacterium U9-1i]
MTDAMPLPTLAQLDDDTQTKLVMSGARALSRLAAGEAIETLSDQEMVGLVALREAEMTAFVTELQRRRLRMNN